MKKFISLVLTVGALFMLASCGGKNEKNESLVELKTTEIPVQEDGSFTIEGTMKNTGTIFTVAGNTIPVVGDKDGNFSHTIKMNDLMDSADLVATYMGKSETVKLKFDTSKYESALQSSSTQDSSVATSETTENSDETSDITQLSDNPTSQQKLTLQNLANQKFKQDYPYEGSKMHSLTGVIQNWTQNDGRWFYKCGATIVNEYGAEKDATVEIFITPTDAESGTVTLDVY